MRLIEIGRAIWRPLASVKETLLVIWVSLDFVCTGLSNMHRCCTFPFALAELLLLGLDLQIDRYSSIPNRLIS